MEWSDKDKNSGFAVGHFVGAFCAGLYTEGNPPPDYEARAVYANSDEARRANEAFQSWARPDVEAHEREVGVLIRNFPGIKLADVREGFCAGWASVTGYTDASGAKEDV